MGGAPSARRCGSPQNPAGFCPQWMQSWMVRGSGPGVITVCRREVVAVVAVLFGCAGVALGGADGGRAGQRPLLAGRLAQPGRPS